MLILKVITQKNGFAHWNHPTLRSFVGEAKEKPKRKLKFYLEFETAAATTKLHLPKLSRSRDYE